MTLILCGLPGCGKTTVGKLLAEKLNTAFIDTDNLIAKEAGQPCREIFTEKGEVYFRELERKVITKFSVNSGVISLGGGALENAKNVQVLNKIGQVIYLQGEVEMLFERANKRGLPAYLDSKDTLASYKRLAEKRTPLYIKAADRVVEIDRLTPDEIVEKIL